jgi:hypothetical protein
MELKLGSYAEITPSGAGFRVMVKAGVPVPTGKKKEFGQRNPKSGKIPGIEVYSSGRFFTFTGNKLPGSTATVEERTEQALVVGPFEIFHSAFALEDSEGGSDDSWPELRKRFGGIITECLGRRAPESSPQNPQSVVRLVLHSGAAGCCGKASIGFGNTYSCLGYVTNCGTRGPSWTS